MNNMDDIEVNTQKETWKSWFWHLDIYSFQTVFVKTAILRA